ncbi:membrane protease YdiL (CAAX protease family) [Saccharopolyspora gloriosae]|uniref:Membrane protease YdiL (CAAX protease family) n=1 Tax=Saccharopolyspora gloriosae TaxID=455344 RepID=A0A840NGU0_9PSEU|nr:membrane protease YdiL (CAAX protease family) [Saccharopolyspora gloriosae]
MEGSKVVMGSCCHAFSARKGTFLSLVTGRFPSSPGGREGRGRWQDGGVGDRVDVRGVVSFVGLSYLGTWVLSIPLWLTGAGLTWTWAPLLLVVMMFVPAASAFAVTKWISPRDAPVRDLGVTNAGGVREWWGRALISWFGPPVLMLVALGLGALLGVYHADWTGFSGLSEQFGLEAGGVGAPSLSSLALMQLVQVMLLGWLNVIPAFGEEVGWRGYLTTALLPLGQPAAFLVTGVLWGLWHAPLLVLGYNYPNAPIVVAFIMMVCFCALLSALLGWLRLATGSVWPAAIGHGFVNAAAGFGILFSAAGHPVDNVTSGLLGWSGWIVLALAILLLVLLGKLPVVLVREASGLTRGVRRLSRR